MKRSEFLRGMLGAMGAGVLASACGEEDGGAGESGGSCDAVTAEVATNHSPGHAVTVPAEDVLLGEAQTYDLTLGGGHTHSITVSAPNMERLAMGESVEVRSTTDAGHEHFVTLSC